MKTDSFTKILSSATAVAAALVAGATFAADLSPSVGPRASLPLWTGFQANSSAGYAWVAGDGSSAYLYEVRSSANHGDDAHARLGDANASGQIGYDHRRYQARLVDLHAEPRDGADIGRGPAPFPLGSFGVSVVPAERPGAARGAFPTRAAAYTEDGSAYGQPQAASARLDGAMLSATLQGNPFLSAGHPFAAVDAPPIAWTAGGDLR